MAYEFLNNHSNKIHVPVASIELSSAYTMGEFGPLSQFKPHDKTYI